MTCAVDARSALLDFSKHAARVIDEVDLPGVNEMDLRRISPQLWRKSKCGCAASAFMASGHDQDLHTRQ
jgi:hypothetical protein